MSRPEHLAPPEIFYDDKEASKYTSNSHILDIQTKLTERALELLLLPQNPCLVLDVGCGSGLSGDKISSHEHHWIGIDISTSMLDVAQQGNCEGDLLLADMGHLLRFRPGSFDGAISISAVQWLCNADRKSHDPYRRLVTFFKWLYAALNKGARAVLQFYPENPEQLEMITSAALRSGFGGGLVIDFPNSTKAKKHFLVLLAGFSSTPPTFPQGLTADEQSQVVVVGRESQKPRGRISRKQIKDRNWIIQKKECQRLRGQDVRPDSKYTGRKRKDKF